jgi:hypothetical protein
MFFGQFYYKAIQVTVSINGLYTFTSVSGIDMYGCLYQGYFNAQNPNMNLSTCNDDSGGNQQFSIRILLQPSNYILVATTYSQSVTGNFTIVVTGPANVNLQ